MILWEKKFKLTHGGGLGKREALSTWVCLLLLELLGLTLAAPCMDHGCFF